MTTALLFIPQIDDQLPELLGFNNDSIIGDYIIREANITYKQYQCLSDEDIGLSLITQTKKMQS